VLDSRHEFRWQEPASRRERWTAGAYVGSLALVALLVVLAIVFDQFAATGVLLVAFLSVILVYLLGPPMEWLRYRASPRRGRPLSRSVTTLALYGVLAGLMLPAWAFYGTPIKAALGRAKFVVPDYTARFVGELRATEGWHESLGMPTVVEASVGAVTRHLTRGVADEARALGTELAAISALVPWLSTVPVVAFVMLTRWHRIRHTTMRVLPTPHLRWRGDEFLRNLDSVLAAYTRAQAFSAVIVGTVCWIGFAALQLPYPGTLALVAGLLEVLPLAGPLITAMVAVAAAPDRVAGVLLFLAALRAVQDYVVYPRLIKRALHLHPLAVVTAIWAGAALGGVIGVCLAIPLVGVLKAAIRHWREYREIELLVANDRIG
jgi:predicted PurR-regulated permease PerM